MDLLAIVGITVAVAAILLGQVWEGGRAASLVNGPALLIVGGGTFGAMMIQAPFDVFRRAMQMLPWVIAPPRGLTREQVRKVVGWGQKARKNGLLGLEDDLDRETDPFARRALQMLVDGKDPATIRMVLEMEINTRENYDLAAARIFESMGGYAPTIGIIGAVMGLIQVMENLSDPTRLGSGIATAFVATIYGVALANLFLLPVANKLKALVRRQSQRRELIMEGVISIADGENPRNIEMKLKSLL